MDDVLIRTCATIDTGVTLLIHYYYDYNKEKSEYKPFGSFGEYSC